MRKSNNQCLSALFLSELQGAPDEDPGQGLTLLSIRMPSETPGRDAAGERVLRRGKSSHAHGAGMGS